MSFDDLKTRGRLQLSRLLHSIECSIEEILSARTEQERDQLEVRALKLYGTGAHKLVNLMGSDPETEDDPLLLSPHACLHADALDLALADIDALASLDHAELYASIAAVMLGAIPSEFRWGSTTGETLEVSDPIELIQITVLAVSAMEVSQRAKRFFEVSEGAKSRAGKAHTENRAMKAKAFEWCDRHMASFKSLDAAAAEIAKSQMPITFRTARSWVGDWKKAKLPAPE